MYCRNGDHYLQVTIIKDKLRQEKSQTQNQRENEREVISSYKLRDKGIAAKYEERIKTTIENKTINTQIWILTK